MIDSFIGLFKLFKFYRNYYIDERVFRMHCTYTSIILLFCGLIITTKQIAGDPIDCDTDRESVKASVLNTFCLIHYTYTVRDAFFKKLGVEVIAPGVRFGLRKDEIHYNYYQWIWFLFFVEALFFYVPRYLWKVWESQTMADLISDYKELMNNKKKQNKKRVIVNYLIKNRRHNKSYGMKYMFCLVLAFFNVLLQMFFINFLFNGEFYAYGLQVFFFLHEDPDVRRDALIKVFPRVTKCRFYKFGSSGSIQDLDALCVLPLNMYNEIIFVFLWFWFAFLALLLSLAIALKIILIISSTLRLYYLKWELKLDLSWDEKRIPSVEPQDLSFGETIVLLLIKQNTGLIFCKELAEDYIKERCIRRHPKRGRKEQNFNDQFANALAESQLGKNLTDDPIDSDNSESTGLLPMFSEVAINMQTQENQDTKIGSE